MTKSEIERILIDPEAKKKLVEASNIIKQSVKIGEDTTIPTTNIRAVGSSPFSIKATNLKRIQRRSMLANIGKYFPELSNETPQRALSILTERYRKDPSESHQFLIHDAINRLTSVGELDKESEEQVSKAIEVLTSLAKLMRYLNPN